MLGVPAMTGWMLAGWIIAFSCDMATTHIGLSLGGHEVVLPTQSEAVIQGGLLSEGVVGAIAYQKLKLKHPKWAQAIYMVGVSSHGIGATFNLSQLVR